MERPPGFEWYGARIAAMCASQSAVTHMQVAEKSAPDSVISWAISNLGMAQGIRFGDFSQQQCLALLRNFLWGHRMIEDFSGFQVDKAQKGRGQQAGGKQHRLWTASTAFEALKALASRLSGCLFPLGPNKTTMLFVRAAKWADLQARRG